MGEGVELVCFVEEQAGLVVTRTGLRVEEWAGW